MQAELERPDSSSRCLGPPPDLQGTDSRPFVLLLQLVRLRELQEVKSLMVPPATLPEAVAWVKKQVSATSDLAPNSASYAGQVHRPHGSAWQAG